VNAYPLAPACWPAALLILTVCTVWRPERRALAAIRTLAQLTALLILTPIAFTLLTS
jgi:hypothetical protein